MGINLDSVALANQFVDNTAYWDQFYKKRTCSEEPSLFACWVSSLAQPGKTMVELGCGNGRDAVYFARKGIKITAVDLSQEAIANLQTLNIPHAEFLCCDFINADLHRPEHYDYAYSRFTIHAISSVQEQMLLRRVFEGLKPGGKFFVEVRSVQDPLFGKGVLVERNAYFYDEHYRRFIVMDELIASMQRCGFRIDYAQEDTGFAPYADSDPPVIRVVAGKPGKE